MKLVRLFLIICVFNILSNFALSVKFSSTAKTNMKIQSAQKLLSDLQNFNKKAESFKNGKYSIFILGNGLGISEDILMNEAKTLDLKYNDLLNIFLEKNENASQNNK